jgi:hypothetical protein
MSSKYNAKKKTAPVEQATPVVTAPSVAPVVGRTIVDIAKELKIRPSAARRIARLHASELGHSAKGARWMLSTEQEQVLRKALTAKSAAAAQ